MELTTNAPQSAFRSLSDYLGTNADTAASSIDCEMLRKIIADIASTRTFDDLGRLALSMLKEILVAASPGALGIVGLTSSTDDRDRLTLWSTDSPQTSVIDLGDFDSGKRLASDIGSANEIYRYLDAVIARYDIGFEAPLRWFRIGDVLFPKGIIVVVQDTPSKRNWTPLADVVAKLCSLAADRIETTQELRRLAGQHVNLVDRLAKASDEERTLIAGDLHDGPIQTLSALAYHLQLAGWRAADGDGDKAAAEIDRAEQILREEIARLRSTMMNLVPPALSERGLTAALREHVARTALEYSNLSISLNCPDGEIEVPEEYGRLLYRIVQEAVVNAIKHARASTIEVCVRKCGTSLVLTVKDDGIGFDTEDASKAILRGHIGLEYMRQRAEILGGSLKIRSSPNKGTCVEIRVDIGSLVNS